jgi:hypothetical protein
MATPLQRRATADNRDSRYVFSNHRTTCVVDRAKKAAAFLCKGWVSLRQGEARGA